MVSLRDPMGASNQIVALSQRRIRMTSPRGSMIRQSVADFLGQMPPSRLPSAADAMRLLERVAMKGIEFPASLIMLSKVMFTLEGILADIVGDNRGIGFTVARRVARRWLANRSAFRSPLKTRDWLTLQCSALLFTSRLWIQWEQAMLDRYLTPGSPASPATN